MPKEDKGEKKENDEVFGGIEKLEKKLYSRKDEIPPPPHTVLKPKKFYLPEDWVPEGQEDDFLKRKEPVQKRKSSPYAKFFIASLVFFAGAAGVAGSIAWSKRNILSPGNVTVEIFGPVSVNGGDELALQVVMENKNNAALKNARLAVNFPEGSRAPNNPSQEFLRYAKTIGTLEPGEIRTETVKVVLLGDERKEKEIRAEFEYSIVGSGAKYTESETYIIRLTAPPISVSVDLLDETHAGQEITLTARAEAVGSTALENALLRIDYPSGFIFRSASPAPLSGDNIWSLGAMRQGDAREIRITGTLQGEDNQEKSFWVYAGLAKNDVSNSMETVFASILRTITLKKPFLGIEVLVNSRREDDYAVKDRKRSVDISILWGNNLPTRIINGEIEVALRGDIVNRNTILVNNGGFFRSVDNKVIWERRTTPALASIESNERRAVGFSFALVRPAETAAFVEKEPVIDIEITVRGMRISEQNVPEEVRSIVNKRVKVATEVTFDSYALHWSGPFGNSGPMPPRVEMETTYTIVWKVKNLSSAVSNALVRSTLPPYIRFIGAVSPITPGLTYNDITHDIIWNVGAIPAGTGYEIPAKEVAFQVALFPSLSHVGQAAELLKTAVFTGRDTFSGLEIKEEARPITTRLTADSQFTSNQAMVEK